VALVLFTTAISLFETRTSAIQAELLSSVAGTLSYVPHDGPSERIVFPLSGPFNTRRGYVNLPEFRRLLQNAGFHIVRQSVFSPEMATLARWGITPLFRDPPVNGLTIRNYDEEVLYRAPVTQRMFSRYEEVPPLVVKSLLFVENQELEEVDPPTRNPVVDWGRTGKALLSVIAGKIGLPVRVEGGSTLATQIEKFRYSENGRTQSPSDKLRQMLSASIKVYRNGTDTRPERQLIVWEYLNSVPLSAAPGYGEVNGLVEGLYAWFGVDRDSFIAAMDESAPALERELAFKRALALICATRAPSKYLLQDHASLEERLDFFTRKMKKAGVLSADFADAVERISLEFLPASTTEVQFAQRKAVTALRNHLRSVLEVSDLYALDRLHLEAKSTLDTALQGKTLQLFQDLRDRKFVAEKGMLQEQLLLFGDPTKVDYSFTVFERTKAGNLLRAQVDTLAQPFDLNEGMKAELGSTAKVRTLAHYLEVVAGLYRELRHLDSIALAKQTSEADPITQWVGETLLKEPGIDLPALLDQALERKYSGSPWETFFTGGGAHYFANFDSAEDYEKYTLREGLNHSVNLVYVRLMRDLVRFHIARLPYDPHALLANPDDPIRQKFLHEIADTESTDYLTRAFRRYRGLPSAAVVRRILEPREATPDRLAVLFLAWNSKSSPVNLQVWLREQGFDLSDSEAVKLFKSYDPARLNLSDYSYLLRLHPMDIWCAGQIVQNRDTSWDELVARSGEARELSSRWLFQPRNWRAQERRLRIRFEEDAFARMTPYWQRLGFPFESLVPSLATAIGSSADRPIALAELMGIILNDGVKLPVLRFQELQFASGTPYETQFAPIAISGERVMDSSVAQKLREALVDVVERGTARRLSGVFALADGKRIPVGGKTGSGDNRFESRRGSRAVSRTGTFVFYIGERYFGVMTAYVGGKEANNYAFTSALAVTALKLLAPAIETAIETATPAKQSDATKPEMAHSKNSPSPIQRQ